MCTRTETSSETIAGHGDSIDGFAPGQQWPRAGQHWPMTLILAGCPWFSAGQGWDWNSRNGSAGSFSVVSSFFQATEVEKCNPQPIEITQGLIFLNVLGSNLVLLKFHFFPLNLDWNPKSLEGKCSKYTFESNEERKAKDLQMCSNIE